MTKSGCAVPGVGDYFASQDPTQIPVSRVVGVLRLLGSRISGATAGDDAARECG